jgi:hypothetical protein
MFWAARAIPSGSNMLMTLVTLIYVGWVVFLLHLRPICDICVPLCQARNDSTNNR